MRDFGLARQFELTKPPSLAPLAQEPADRLRGHRHNVAEPLPLGNDLRGKDNRNVGFASLRREQVPPGKVEFCRQSGPDASGSARGSAFKFHSRLPETDELISSHGTRPHRLGPSRFAALSRCMTGGAIGPIVLVFASV